MHRDVFAFFFVVVSCNNSFVYTHAITDADMKKYTSPIYLWYIVTRLVLYL